MKDIICYRLRFTAPLHLGTSWEGYEEMDDALHSDTIFSAIMSVFPMLYEDSIEEMCIEPSFICSSAFPFYDGRYFFSRPMLPVLKETDFDPVASKKLKRVKYIEKNIFERILEGERFSSESLVTSADGRLWLGGGDDGENIAISTVSEIPRIVKDRISDSTTIFYFSQMAFAENAGLFFLCRYRKPELRNKIETVLRLLGDEGLGADRTVGKGTFKVEVDESFSIRLQESGRRFVTMSLFHPSEDDIKNGVLDNSSYDIVERGGWVASSGTQALWKGRVRMFAEGSVFTGEPTRTFGDVVRLLEKGSLAGHGIYRMGMAFPFPCSSKGENE